MDEKFSVTRKQKYLTYLPPFRILVSSHFVQDYSFSINEHSFILFCFVLMSYNSFLTIFPFISTESSDLFPLPPPPPSTTREIAFSKTVPESLVLKMLKSLTLLPISLLLSKYLSSFNHNLSMAAALLLEIHPRCDLQLKRGPCMQRFPSDYMVPPTQEQCAHLLHLLL